MGTDFLSQIIEYKQHLVTKQKHYRSESSLRNDAEKCLAHRPFIKPMENIETDTIHIIAEIKRASPSKGMIQPDLVATDYAAAYERGGASAISVLTEDHWFKGNIDDLTDAREATTLPILRKDFTISTYQIYESAVINADAILLIVRILFKNQLKDYLDLCTELNLDALVEIHTHDDIQKMKDTGARLIGINNRNLKSFDTDIDTAIDLKAGLAYDQIPVAASGIQTKDDIKKTRTAGISHFLIGESIVRSTDPENFIKSLKNEETAF
ncbi:MAG: indole-3-glycerol phosphate synthase TrpC [Desulfobacteraceae bacterium]|nr:indole-3-glycerol phosphate synthase TrpC [Desulfobacteraceae bacterium]MBC2755673.1 indole-3-glycerol phosphate synthase TrpC [Desulfobacteraceae bacterium]